jgi:hypothetical protein
MQQSDLESRGWCVDFDKFGTQASVEATERDLLDLDIRKVKRGVGCLPADINGRSYGTLEGPHVLQLMDFRDVSGPSRFNSPSSSTSSKNRLLMLRLTDGVRECKALEARKPISCLNLKALLPGMKIRVKRVPVRHGVLILNEGDIDVLGGRVSNLAEAYEAQQLYGGANRSQTGPTPPKFKPFDPTRPAKRSTIDAKMFKGEIVGKNSVDLSTEGNKQTQEKKEQRAKVTSAAAANLLEKMSDKRSGGDRGRGRGRGRRSGGRRQGRDDDGLGSTQGTMTLDEWEASKKKLPGNECDIDHELAMKLQEQFDLEDRHNTVSLQEDLQNSLYQKSNQMSASAAGTQIHGSVDHRGRGSRGRKRASRRGRR